MNDEHLNPLWQSYAQSRSLQARDQLFEAYLPMAHLVARKFTDRGVEREDLEQVAAMGLLKAMERFDPGLGYRFVTYAVPTITGDVRNYLRDKGSLMRLPRDGRQRLYALSRERQRFESEQLRAPTVAELAERLHTTVEDVLTLMSLQAAGETVSLDMPVGEEGDMQLQDILGGEDSQFASAENADWMEAVLSRLNDTERQLVELRYQQGLGQRETARRLGVSQMQVSRMERRMLARLRAMESGS